MDIHELKQFESVYQPSKEIAFCWLRKQYVQLSTEENHAEVVDHANDSLRIWQAAKAHEAEKLKGCVVVPTTPSYEMWSGIARDLGRYMQMHDRYCPKTLKKYFDRFIGDIPEWLNKEVKDWNSDHAFATADLPAFIYMSMLEAARSQS